MVRLPQIAKERQEASYGHNSNIYELKLRKKLLQQQLCILDSRCQRVAGVLEKKARAKQNTTDNPAAAGAQPGGLAAAGKGRRERRRSMGGTGLRLTEPGAPAHALVPAMRQASLSAPALAPESMLERRRHQLVEEMRRKKEVADRRVREREAEKAANRIPPKAPDVPRSFFPSRYERGELPCNIVFKSAGKGLSWMCPLAALDFEYYLPIFLDGIRCPEDPCQFMARQGCHDLIEAAAGHPERVLPCIPEMVKGLRWAFATKEDGTLRAALKVIKQLILTIPEAGRALVPYYKIFLPVLNLNLERFSNLGDQMDYKQQDIGDYVGEVLELLERTGGKNAFQHIKMMVPLYEHYSGN